MNDVITSEQLTTYLDKILHSNMYKRVIATLDVKDVNAFFWNFTNIISKYYISTLDGNIANAIDICLEYFNYKGDDFFRDILMNRIVSVCSSQLNIEEQGIEKYYKVSNLVYERNQNNHFYTHCFPGAVMDDVNKNGLDATKIKFKEETEILKRHGSSFKVGDLYYCDLSGPSLSYAVQGMPESTKYLLGCGNANKAKEGEMLFEAYNREFDGYLEELKNNNVDKDELDQINVAGRKMIDFYTKKGTSGIAIFKTSNKITSNGILSEKYINSVMTNISAVCQKYFGIGSFLYKQIEEIEKKIKSNPEEMFSTFDREFELLCTENEQLKKIVTSLINDSLAYYFEHRIINNYLYDFGGNANGYEVPGKKLSRDKFSILEIDIPTELHNKLNMDDIELLERKDDIHQNDLEQQASKFTEVNKVFESLIKSGEEIDEIFIMSFGKNKLIGYKSNGELKIHNRFIFNKDGIEYVSNKSERYLGNIIMSRKVKEYIKSNPVDSIVDIYKKTESYEKNKSFYDGEDSEDLIYDAVEYYFEIQSNSLSPEEKRNELIEEALKDDNIQLIERDGGLYAKIEKDNQYSIILIDIEPIYSKENNAPYNSLYEDRKRSM